MALTDTSQVLGGVLTDATLTQMKANAVNPIYGLPRISFTDTITAHSGGTQALATPITTGIARITVVAAAGDSVSLPVSQPGLEILVINSGANSMQVYGAGTDTINGIATATGVSQGPGAVVVYTCLTAGSWFSDNGTSVTPSIALLAASGAINPHQTQVYVITKAGVAAMTLAAPTAGTDDGVTLTITSNTAFAHTITATGLMQTGTATVNLATFAAFAGASITFIAYNGKFNVLNLNAVVLT